VASLLKKAVASLLKRTIMLQVSTAPRQKGVLGAFTGSLIYSPQPRFFVVLPRLFKA
jgi:hypothetical protein